MTVKEVVAYLLDSHLDHQETNIESFDVENGKVIATLKAFAPSD